MTEKITSAVSRCSMTLIPFVSGNSTGQAEAALLDLPRASLYYLGLNAADSRILSSRLADPGCRSSAPQKMGQGSRVLCGGDGTLRLRAGHGGQAFWSDTWIFRSPEVVC